MKTSKLKKIGILGGIGPAASSSLYGKLINLAQDIFGAEQDSDFPPMVINSIAMVGFDETGFTDPKKVKKQLIDGVRMLESAGCDFIIIACNTVHFFINEMRAVVKIPIVSIIDESVRTAKASHSKKLGVLSSESTYNLRIYADALEKNGITPILATHSQQEMLNSVILNVMAGIQGKRDTRIIGKIIYSMKRQGAEGIILGCTEIPLAIHQDDSALPLFDSTHIITEAALNFAYNKRTMHY